MDTSQLEDTARHLAIVGASQEVITDELIKMGANYDLAESISARVKRDYRLKRISPYLIALLICVSITYYVVGPIFSIVLGMLSFIIIFQLYRKDQEETFD